MPYVKPVIELHMQSSPLAPLRPDFLVYRDGTKFIIPISEQTERGQYLTVVFEGSELTELQREEIFYLQRRGAVVVFFFDYEERK